MLCITDRHYVDGILKEWVFAAFFFDVIFAFISGYSFPGVIDIVKPSIAFVLILLTYIQLRKINPALRISYIDHNEK